MTVSKKRIVNIIYRHILLHYDVENTMQNCHFFLSQYKAKPGLRQELQMTYDGITFKQSLEKSKSRKVQDDRLLNLWRSPRLRESLATNTAVACSLDCA